MKILFVFLFCISFISSHSQDTVFVLNKKFKGAAMMSPSFKVLSSIDKNSGELHLTAIDNKTAERYIIDSNWKIVEQISSSRGVFDEFPFERFNNMQLITVGRKELTIYKIEGKTFTVNEVDFNTKKEFKIGQFTVNSKETIIKYFTQSNIFCLITAVKKTNMLKIVTNAQRGGISFDTISVDLNIDKAGLTAEKIMEYAEIIHPYDDSIEKLVAANKIYYSKEHIYISNDVKTATYITEVNLRTGNISRKIFPQEINDNGAAKIKQGALSSFLYNNTVVTANVSNRTLSVIFYNYDNETLIKKYILNEGNLFSYKYGYIYNREGKSVPQNREVVLKNGSRIQKEKIPDATMSRDFINDLKKHMAVRLDNKGNDQIKLVIVSYVYESSGGGGIIEAGGGPTLPGGGGWTTTTTSIGAMGDEYIVTDKYINVFFQPGKLEHIANPVETKSITELIKDASGQNRTNTKSVFIKNKAIYLGVYDSKKEMYTITKVASAEEL